MKNYLSELLVTSYIEIDRNTSRETMKWDVSIYNHGQVETLETFGHKPTQEDLNMINIQLQISNVAAQLPLY